MFQAAREASLVLPTPPTPVRLTSREEDSACLTWLSSLRRPTKLVTSVGHFSGKRCADTSVIAVPG